ncbi:molybdenum cofactor biosynthesis protein MoaE [Sphingosinicella sp. YJ22]|uniref:molybdenum cofactor biosynthesis protein MoaE n=1 Tax=Sphingosinicella sp. YJ22 TaxID=1104780 RepID=UPI00140AA5C8|nr:molybdenum cofactor biosynthesis protein MoaE [Sphingosinicella sp. YJ22]
MIEARLTDLPLDPAAELSRFMAKLADEGAVVSFAGIARPRNRDGADVERMFLDHHPRITQSSIDDIAQAASRRFAVGAITAVHRFGEVLPGETIVFVAAASLHRRAAFEAADYVMDRLKTDAVLWKREDSVDGSRWIEPTEADRADRARWSE